MAALPSRITDYIGASAEKLADLSAVGFDSIIGFRFTELSVDGAKAEIEIRPDLHQPYGIVHGGVYCAVIESMTSMSAAAWLGDDGYVVGVSNTTDFLRSVSEGTLYAVTSPLHRGRSQQLWEARITDEHGRVIAHGQVRLHNMTRR
jgi:uncharacterized protein (TIGR00369 family)